MHILLLLQNAVMAALAATGFALIFNVPRRALALCALCGAIGVTFRTVLLNIGGDYIHIAAATLCASIVVASVAEFLSRKMLMPPSVFSVPGVIPMIPGSLMFRSVVYWLSMATESGSDFDTMLFGEALMLAANAMVVLAAIALGIAAPNLILYRRRTEA
jgi:uncharacterized membrane protein YjjB (DUF3815 family)